MENIVVPINYWAVLASGVSSMIIGSLWYGPLFGKPWMKEMGLKPDKMDEAAKKGMTKSYLLMFAGSLLMAYVLAHAIVFARSYFKLDGITTGLITGFWDWLGFVAPVTLSSMLWEGKSFKLWLINNGYNVVNLLTMGAILGSFIA